jgi:Arc/MetJ-type ribon-helix-helix transcriptional regulator
MSTQITVRLPDVLVSYIDAEVTAGEATSRAAVVARAVERDRRRRIAERDAAVYARVGDDPDLAAFTRHATASDLGLD